MYSSSLNKNTYNSTKFYCMIRNFFKIAFRNISRHKGFSLINIAGLTLGLTACILIGLFVWDEKQFDQSVPGGDQVYRVCNEVQQKGETDVRAWVPPMFAATLQQEYPEVGKSLRIMNIQSK